MPRQVTASKNLLAKMTKKLFYISMFLMVQITIFPYKLKNASLCQHLLAKSKKIWIAKVGVRVKSDLWFFCPAGGYFLKKLSKKDHTLAWVAIFIKAFWNCKILVSERVFNEEFILFPEEKNICMQSYPEWS